GECAISSQLPGTVFFPTQNLGGSASAFRGAGICAARGSWAGADRSIDDSRAPDPEFLSGRDLHRCPARSAVNRNARPGGPKRPAHRGGESPPPFAAGAVQQFRQLLPCFRIVIYFHLKTPLISRRSFVRPAPVQDPGTMGDDGDRHQRPLEPFFKSTCAHQWPGGRDRYRGKVDLSKSRGPQERGTALRMLAAVQISGAPHWGRASHLFAVHIWPPSDEVASLVSAGLFPAGDTLN